jgi:hypothetical protein
MKKTTWMYASLFLTVLIVAATGFLGCKSSDDARQSQKGEACQTTNDCAGGLSCIPIPSESIGVCVTSQFNIAKTAKSCKIIQCSSADDCCAAAPKPSIQCQQLAAECADAGSFSTFCTEYQDSCPTAPACDPSHYACNDGTCQFQCNTDTDCGGAEHCSGGQCVQCTQDSDCSDSFTCDTDNGTCQPPCTTDADCPAFNRCNNGQCQEGGCQSDRECVAATKNVQAKCDSSKDNGTCIIPCTTDLECGNPTEYSFYSCISNQCVYTGCDSDKECELYLNGGNDAGFTGTSGFGVTEHVECVDPSSK